MLESCKNDERKYRHCVVGGAGARIEAQLKKALEAHKTGGPYPKMAVFSSIDADLQSVAEVLYDRVGEARQRRVLSLVVRRVAAETNAKAPTLVVLVRHASPSSTCERLARQSRAASTRPENERNCFFFSFVAGY